LCFNSNLFKKTAYYKSSHYIYKNCLFIFLNVRLYNYSLYRIILLGKLSSWVLTSERRWWYD